jgi:hypothetical protein
VKEPIWDLFVQINFGSSGHLFRQVGPIWSVSHYLLKLLATRICNYHISLSLLLSTEDAIIATLWYLTLCSLEKVNMKSKCGRAKVLGTVVCIGGALLLTLYKGTPLNHPHSRATTQITNHSKTERWAIGSILNAAGCLLWSSWFLIQAKIGKRYPCQYTSTAILNLFGAIQSAILSLIVERNLGMWVLKGKLEILTVIYAVSTTFKIQMLQST